VWQGRGIFGPHTRAHMVRLTTMAETEMMVTHIAARDECGSSSRSLRAMRQRVRERRAARRTTSLLFRWS
jgi:hypothetical protein